MKAKDLKSSDPKILIYGPAGTGKTALVSQASGGYLFSFDSGGMQTALNLQDEFTKYRHSIEFDEFVDTNPDRPSAYRKFKEKLFSFVQQLQRDKDKFPYDALVVDSLTAMGQAAMREVMANVGRTPSKSGVAMQGPEIQHWGLAIADLRNMITLLTSLPIMILVTSHDIIQEENDGSVKKRPNALGSKLPSELPPYFSEVWLASVKVKPQRKFDFTVSWMPSSTYETRTRTGVMQELSVVSLGLRGILKEIGYSYNQEPTK